MSYEEENTPPVSEGNNITATCISLGKKGDGIFKYENFIVVVPETEVDQEYDIEITRVLRKMAFGKVVE